MSSISTALCSCERNSGPYQRSTKRVITPREGITSDNVRSRSTPTVLAASSRTGRLVSRARPPSRCHSRKSYSGATRSASASATSPPHSRSTWLESRRSQKSRVRTCTTSRSSSCGTAPRRPRRRRWPQTPPGRVAGRGVGREPRRNDNLVCPPPDQRTGRVGTHRSRPVAPRENAVYSPVAPYVIPWTGERTPPTRVLPLRPVSRTPTPCRTRFSVTWTGALGTSWRFHDRPPHVPRRAIPRTPEGGHGRAPVASHLQFPPSFRDRQQLVPRTAVLIELSTVSSSSTQRESRWVP